MTIWQAVNLVVLVAGIVVVGSGAYRLNKLTKRLNELQEKQHDEEA